MLVIGQALTNSAAIPILLDGMMCCRSARPDDFPILERTGQVLAPITPILPLAGARPKGIRAALPGGLPEFRTE